MRLTFILAAGLIACGTVGVAQDGAGIDPKAIEIAKASSDYLTGQPQISFGWLSKGRTIREFVLGVLIGPTVFSVIWFGAFGGIGLFDALQGTGGLLAMTESNVERVTFTLLERLPLPWLTTVAAIAAAFLFIVTSVFSAAFVLGTFSHWRRPEPKPTHSPDMGRTAGTFGCSHDPCRIHRRDQKADRHRRTAICLYVCSGLRFGIPVNGSASGVPLIDTSNSCWRSSF